MDNGEGLLICDVSPRASGAAWNTTRVGASQGREIREPDVRFGRMDRLSILDMSIRRTGGGRKAFASLPEQGNRRLGDCTAQQSNLSRAGYIGLEEVDVTNPASRFCSTFRAPPLPPPVGPLPQAVQALSSCRHLHCPAMSRRSVSISPAALTLNIFHIQFTAPSGHPSRNSLLFEPADRHCSLRLLIFPAERACSTTRATRTILMQGDIAT